MNTATENIIKNNLKKIEVKKRCTFFGIRSKNSHIFLQFWADIISIIFSYLIHYYIRFKTEIFGTAIHPDYTIVITTGILFLAYWLTMFWLFGLYKNWYIRSPFDETFSIIKVTFTGSFIIFFFVFLDSSKSPRLLFLLYFVLIAVLVTIFRFVARKLQKKFREKGIVSIPSIIFGTKTAAYDIFNRIKKARAWGYSPIGFIQLNSDNRQNISDNIIDKEEMTELGTMDNLNDVLDSFKPEEVIISAENPNHSVLLKIVSLCSDKKIIVKIEPDLYQFFTGQARTLPLYGIPFIEINTQLLKPLQAAIKRATDIIVSLLVIPLGLPLWLIIASIIKLESKGPVFYQQVRIGKNGKPFKMTKFRSMVKDAEKQGPQWAKVGDARVTKFGYFLRRSHLDETPQFFNVLKGEMSLVGPRPERPHFVEKYSAIIPYYNRRHSIRPGLTGWWQINYTSYDESIEEIESRLKLDFYYIENMSLKLDIEIMIRTIYCVIKGHGQA